MFKVSTHLRAYWLAQQFLTRIPVPEIKSFNQDDQARSALYYPVVGLVIACLLSLVSWTLAKQSPLLAASIITAIWASITGALHLDGLADSADAWLGGQGSLEKTHKILKDPLVGTAGLVTVSLILLLKFSALIVLIENQHLSIILLAPIIGRALILLLFLTTDYVRKNGLASDITAQLNRPASTVITIIVFIIAALNSISGAIGILLIFAGLRHMMIKRLNGCTGDTTGALVEIGEVSWLVAVALSIPP